MLANLSLVWQVWSVMLLGAVLMLAIIVTTIEWPWIRMSARAAGAAVVATWRALFTDADLQADARHVPTITTTRRDADEILIAVRGRGYVSSNQRAGRLIDLEEQRRRRQPLALCESSPFRKTVH